MRLDRGNNIDYDLDERNKLCEAPLRQVIFDSPAHLFTSEITYFVWEGLTMVHQIKSHCLTVTVAEHGAELQSILSRDGTEYLWQGDAAYWTDRAPNLFPYVARLTDGRYYLDGQLYHMDIHGFAPYLDFTVREQQDARLVMELTSTEETLADYPRAFAFRVGYELQENTLAVTYEVENRDERNMYFGLGAHPGLRVPLREGQRFEDYRLRFESPCCPRRVGFTDDCFLDGTDRPFSLVEGQFLPLTHSLFDDDAIVLKDAGHRVTLETAGDKRSVSVEFPGMDYLGLWHRPRTDAPYLCIEPWCSLPSTKGKIAVFEEQEDLIRLDPGDCYQNTWKLLFHGIGT